MLGYESGNVRKKRKRSHSTSSSEYDSESDITTNALARQLLLEELDLETRIRQRLQETIQSRITWALLLQESLAREAAQTILTPRQGANEFQNAALEALEALEEPCLSLFSRELRPLSDPILRIPSQPSSPALSTLPLPLRPDTRRTRRDRPLPPPSRAPVKLLFLRNTADGAPALAKLACPDCARTDFPSVQGLLNHCRLGHAREFGSHDECIATCAVPVPPAEREFVLTHGTELAEANLPGLRRLFEIAVGGSGTSKSHTPAPVAEERGQENAQGNGLQVQASTLLSRTLGHHIDTPALAPFLGLTAKRRCIQVHDENAPVDITGTSIPAGLEQQKSKPHWRMAYHHRSRARPALDMEEPAGSAESEGTALPQSGRALGARVPFDAVGSRFHILARVSVTDYSLWLPKDCRPPAYPEHTHRWMLRVDSPSYSLHITAFLAKMTVTCLSSPAPASLAEPLVITAPPFAATSTTDRPFLARVALTWVGAQNPVMEVEHWVELDAFKSANPVLGDEQVLDVELDRTTELLPVQPSANRVTRALWERPAAAKTSARKQDPLVSETRGTGAVSDIQNQDSREPRYANLLRSLLPRFPLTLRDSKGRAPPHVPYKLVASPAQFRALVPGRRKAIEWGRAHALREAYDAARNGVPPEAGYEALSTADVFCWLRDGGLSPRAAPERATSAVRDAKSKDQSIGAAEKSSPPARSDATVAFCPSCGGNLSRGAHAPSGAPCRVAPGPVPRLPLLDVRAFLADAANGAQTDVQAAPPLRPNMFAWSARELAGAADPGAVAAVRGAIASLRLASFASRSADAAAGMPGGGRTDGPALDTVGAVSPYALLSLALRAFVRRLLLSGVGVLREDVARAAALGRGHERAAKDEDDGAVLAPAHLVRGIQGTSREARALRALLTTFGSGVRTQARTQIAMETEGVLVKREEDHRA